MILTIETKNRTELQDITSLIQNAIHRKGVSDGICFVYVPHTTAAVTINESADPDVKDDILKIINKLIPWQANYRHLEGNSAAHIKTSIIGTSELVPVENGKLVLGTWQGIFFCEFDGPRTRKLHVSFVS